ncbi:receptor expression-enhancing protein 1 isoform X2 [Macrosteles quadrilineatus]|uniref:receptor expression-enhancing protein 1 isoform X2 n=1 Tax=Macrosteles quadrilineatus TaxID=74068 RepID=UPI0023E2646C|nr:receptor expression-enhancing protein 1 isoform X2 [Macrosteles quadrilineatus]
MISAIISRLVILVFGTLYPAYASYKAVRTKNVKEYVKWMMYWIVFALFTCAETFTDLFLSFWFPFYYEIKIVLVLWLLSPATKGSSILYRNFVHPALTKREQEIDEYISKAKEQGYHTMLQLGSKGVTYATNVIMQTAIKGGGGLVNHIRRSYSLSDLSDDMDIKSDLNRNSKLHADNIDSADVPRDSRRTPRKTVGSHVDLYFPEMDVDIRSHSHELPVSLSQIRSTEDISSGYSSSGEGQVVMEGGNPLMRTASVGGARTRGRGARNTAPVSKKPSLTEVPLWAEYCYNGDKLLARITISHPAKLCDSPQE